MLDAGVGGFRWSTVTVSRGSRPTSRRHGRKPPRPGHRPRGIETDTRPADGLLAGRAAKLELEDQELFEERRPVAGFGLLESVFDARPVAAAPAAFKIFANRVNAAGLLQVAASTSSEPSPNIRPSPRWRATFS